MNRIVALISHDPAMTLSILNAVNSSVFGYSKKISSVNEAIYAIGMTRTLSLAFACKVSDLNQNPKVTTRIWSHLRSVAEITTKLFKLAYINEFTANTAYTTGLLHDCGIFLLSDDEAFSANVLKNSLGCDSNFNKHDELGAMLLEKWGMAEIVFQSARYHHSINDLPSTLSTQVYKMVALLYLTERVDDLIQRPMPGAENKIASDCHIALDILNIPEDNFIDAQYDLIEASVA